MAQSFKTVVREADAEQGPMGQLYLAHGQEVALRLWDEEPTTATKTVSARNYETVGYVLKGCALLTVGNDLVELNTGDSWLVRKGAEHTYEIREHFRALEATSPPARQDGRDAATSGKNYSPSDVLA